MKNYNIDTITPEEIDKEVEKAFNKPEVKKAFKELDKEFKKEEIKELLEMDTEGIFN